MGDYEYLEEPKIQFAANTPDLSSSSRDTSPETVETHYTEPRKNRKSKHMEKRNLEKSKMDRFQSPERKDKRTAHAVQGVQGATVRRASETVRKAAESSKAVPRSNQVERMNENSAVNPQLYQDIRNILDPQRQKRPNLDAYLNTNDRTQDIDQLRERIQEQHDVTHAPESRITAEDRAFDNNSFNMSLASMQGVRRQPHRIPHAMQIMEHGFEYQDNAHVLEEDFDGGKWAQPRDFSSGGPRGVQGGAIVFESAGRGQQRGFSAPPSGRGPDHFALDNMSGKWSTVKQDSISKPYIPRTTHPDKFGKQLINFQLDVGDLNPEELEIKTSPQRRVYIRGFRKDVEDGKPVFREYRNSVKIPENIDINELKSVLTPDGLLRFTAPLVQTTYPTGNASHGPRSQDVEIKIRKM